MVTYVGMEPLPEGDRGGLEIRTGDGSIDLRAGYAVIDVHIDLVGAEVRFFLFGEGRAALLTLSGVSEIYSPATSGGEPFTFFTDQSLMTRPDTLRVTQPKGAPDGSRWFTLETDGGLSLSVRGSRAAFSTEVGHGAGGQLLRGLMYARVRQWPVLRSDDNARGKGGPTGADLATDHRLDLAEIDLVNDIVRLVVAGPRRRHIIRFEDVKDIRTAPARDRDLWAHVAEPKADAVLTRLGPLGARSGASDQWYEAVTSGGFEIAVRAGRVEEAILVGSSTR